MLLSLFGTVPICVQKFNRAQQTHPKESLTNNRLKLLPDLPSTNVQQLSKCIIFLIFRFLDSSSLSSSA